MSKSVDTEPETAIDPRLLWEEGQWHALSRLDLGLIASMEHRGTAALFVAAAHFHRGDALAAMAMLRQATDWGATETEIASVLFGGVSNTLGRIALLLEDTDRAEAHFRDSVAAVHMGDGADKTAFVRQFHEMLDLALLPAAAESLSDIAAAAKQDLQSGEPWAILLDSKIELLKHALTLALQKGDLAGRDTEPTEADKLRDDAEQHSVSQLNQDVWVLENCGFKRGGFFVEFGATNGVLLSNSYQLETRFDWSGICAEPNPEYFAQLEQNRKCIVSQDCIGGETGKTVQFITADEFGGFAEYASDDMHAQKRQAYVDNGRVLELTTISLHDFLVKYNAPKTIDYLSIDTEGSEYEILATFPFDEWDVRTITVEHNFTSMRDKIKDLLLSHGYVRTEAQWDDWYAKVDQKGAP